MYSNTCARLFAHGEAFPVDRFDLQAVAPALHRRVVIAVAPDAHAGDGPVFVQRLAVLLRAALTSSAANSVSA